MPQENLIRRSDFSHQGLVKLIDSDVASINLDLLLKVWLSQLIDNALSCKPSYIEVRLYCKGALGFDVVDNGCGYTQTELQTMCKILFNRERNEIYKKKSIGFRGEALSSICKSCRLTIMTRSEEEPTGLKVTLSKTGDI